MCLFKNFMEAIKMTYSLPLPEVKELCQWEKQLHEQVSNPAVFEKLWESVPTPSRECVVYDWPESETA